MKVKKIFPNLQVIPYEYLIMNISKNPALILMDLQKGFDKANHWGGNRNNPNAELVCKKLLSFWREVNLPIFHVRHNSQDPQSELHESKKGFDFKEETLPLAHETIITKNVNSAFIGTNLKELLEKESIQTVVIIGLTTNHCVSTSARMAGNFGFSTFVISDATATFDRTGINGQFFDAETIHQTALASIHNEFAKVLPSDQLISILKRTL
jgi:nicotinamidase-related amidase